ncbi:UvrD-helicase domain-containing protein [Lacticaseibacillus paracasei]|uniref:UvrD-helicase domain-containing protein n=1 Tax=Lacticaseibacillus paracasei TaxID=1597 RepID=UPI001EF1A8D0|nr:UvrD-helicase domain-containing protein [Lacticaseibacillus paracasei]
MQIESILLHGAHFTAEQREVIQAIGRIDVVAGPGSGKTTVLAAKVLRLLTTRNYEDKGICCITHTNVAVKEILARLKLAGVLDCNNKVTT